MTLRQLIDGIAVVRVIGDPDIEVGAVREDSRTVSPGDVFVAVRGLRSDGHTFIRAAHARGAAGFVVEDEREAAQLRDELSQRGITQLPPIVVVVSTLAVLGVLTARHYGTPASAMTLIGITGTNGKTTTTYLVEAILRAAGIRVGVISTVEIRFGTTVLPASYTTPTPDILHDALAKMRASGCTHVVMEVTSSAIALERVAGLSFAVAAFTNLTQDHLDLHGSMAEYRAAKRRLFSDFTAANGVAVINIDDPEGEKFQGVAPQTVAVSTKANKPAPIHVTRAESSVRGIRMTVATPRGELAIASQPLIGGYNVQNIALAVGIAEALAIAPAAIASGIETTAPPGRLERVPNSANLDIFVDYAHTPDALHNVLTTLRALTSRRLICVFGCGGDRDPTKRPAMGAVVAEAADVVVVTSDNPRTEDPHAIIDMILPAVPTPLLVDVDRRVAIRAAIDEATPGDIVVIAGKGHEDYQVIAAPGGGTTKIHFDDREQAAAAVAERRFRSLEEIARDAGGTVVDSPAVPGGPAQSPMTLGTPRRGTTDTAAVIDRVVIDSRLARPGALYVAIRGETHDGHAFIANALRAGAGGAVVDHAGFAALHTAPLAATTGSVATGVLGPLIEVDDTRIALGTLARAHRRAWTAADKKLIAITGSAGKTTTKELTRAAFAMAGTTHAAHGSFNNETGVPLTLLALRAFHQFCVVEMGMRGQGQIEYLTRIAEPDIAVVVNAGTAHIELLGSTDAIAKAKAEIWTGLSPSGVVVRPAHDPRLEMWAKTHAPRARHVTFGDASAGGADVALVDYTPMESGAVATLTAFGSRHQVALQLVGRHAAIDACAAIAAACAVGVPIENALRGIARQRPVAMRGEVVDVHGRKVIVDCYNANPASMAAALHTLAERATHGRALAVLGDMLELGDHAVAAHRATGALARTLGLAVVALGEHAAALAEEAGPAAEVVATPALAAERALAQTQPGDWILLKASRGIKLERVLEAMQE